MSLLDKLFVDMRVISKIPEGGRVCTTGTGQIKIEDTKTFGGWMATGRRRLTGDSRDEAVKVLMQIINDVSELSDNIIDSIRNNNSDGSAVGLLNENVKKCHTLEKICMMLKSSKKGIVHLHGTYFDDANVTAKLEEVMEKMDQQHDRIIQVLEYVRLQTPALTINGSAHETEIQVPPQGAARRVASFSPRHEVVAPLEVSSEDAGFSPFGDEE